MPCWEDVHSGVSWLSHGVHAQFTPFLASLAPGLCELHLSLRSHETGFKEGSGVDVESRWVPLKGTVASKGTSQVITGFLA